MPTPSSLFVRLTRLLKFKFLAEGLSQILGLTLFLALSRLLGAQGYGQYSYALSFAFLLQYICLDFGLNTFVVREVSKAPEHVGSLLTHIWVLRLGLTALMLLFMWVWGDPLLFWGSVFVCGMAWIETACAFYHGLEILQYELWLKVLQRSVSVGVALLVLWWNPDVKAVLMVTALSTWGALVLGLALGPLTRMPWSRFQWPLLKGYFKNSLPFWFTVIFFVVYTRIDVVMLNAFGRPDSELGWYQASVKIVDLLNLFPQLAALAIFPVLTRLKTQRTEDFQQLVSYLLLWVSQLALPLSVGGLLVSQTMLNTVLGPEYAKSVPSFQVLLWGLVFHFHNFFLFYILAVLDKEISGVRAALVGMVLNVGLNLWMIPLWGYMGAAWSTLFTEALVWGINVWILNRTLRPRLFWGELLKTIVALTMMFSGVYWGLVKGKWAWPYGVFLGVLIYGVLLYLSRAPGKRSEILPLLQVPVN